jgi:hypothetical protein
MIDLLCVGDQVIMGYLYSLLTSQYADYFQILNLIIKRYNAKVIM